MASLGSFFNRFISLLLLLIHLGCFTFTIKSHRESSKNKRKISPLCPSTSLPSIQKPHKSTLSSSLSYILQIIHPLKTNSPKRGLTREPTPAASPAPSTRSSKPPLPSRESTVVSEPSPALATRRNGIVSSPESNISGDDPLFPLRNDIFPCTACGEIFPGPQLLDQHQSLKHAVSELRDGDSGMNVVRIIFLTAWTNKAKSPRIHRILKIHNGSRTLARFEEYRELVKLRAARNGVVRGRGDARCLADGNELLRFHCSTFLCGLGEGGGSSVCAHAFCSACGIIRSGFSPKMDGISTLSSSWRAHAAIPEDMEQEFAFMNMKRATLVCRVVAGRVGYGSVDDDVDKAEGGGFDSVVGRGEGPHHRVDEEELLVFNPRAVLPCFLIVYSV